MFQTWAIVALCLAGPRNNYQSFLFTAVIFVFLLDICLKICYTIDIVGKCFKLGQLASYVRLCHEAFINFLLDICQKS